MAGSRLEAALVGSPVVAFEQDRELRYAWAHGAVWGRDPAQLLGKRDREVHERAEDAAAIHALTSAVLADGHARRGEVGVTSRGVERRYDLTVQPIHWAGGELVGVACVAVDVTERVGAEAVATRRAEAAFRALFHNPVVGMAELDAEGRFIDVNERACLITGYSREELLGVRATDLRVPEERGEGARLFEELMRGDRTGNPRDMRSVHKSGHASWLQIAVAVARSPSGVPERAFALVQDISDRKRAELAAARRDGGGDYTAARREAEARALQSDDAFRALFHNPLLGVAEIDAEGRFLAVNDRVCVMMGYEREELLGRRSIDLRVPEERHEGEQLFAEIMGGGRPGIPRDVRSVRKDGGVIWTQLSMVFVRDSTGVPTRAFVLVRDVTDRLRAEVALARVQEAPRASERRGAEPSSGAHSQRVDHVGGRGPSLAAPAGIGIGRLVLVVEPDLDARDSIVDLLEVQGHRVRTARNGASALELARETQPEVVLCNVLLPDMTGLELARAFRGDAVLDRARLIALGDLVQAEDEPRTADAGFDAQVASPLDADILLRALWA